MNVLLLERPAHVAEYVVDNSQKITEIRSCSDCCMECNPDGTPNLVGRLHQARLTRTYKDGSTELNCRECPVFQNISDADWQQMLNDIDGSE